MSRRRLAGLPIIALVALVGCGGGKPHPNRVAVCPASGKVVLEGRPAAGALLVFHPRATIELPVLPRATVAPDGLYSVDTYEHADGLPEGEYVVTALWTSKPQGADESVEGMSRIHENFTRKETTPLRATIIRGADGRCTIPVFNLTR